MTNPKVKLWFNKVVYGLLLGDLVSVWTPHVSAVDSNSFMRQRASLSTSIFPERDNSCYLMVQKNSDNGTLCKTPLTYREGKELDGLMTLKNFMAGGHDVQDGKILLYVKRLGHGKKCESIF